MNLTSLAFGDCLLARSNIISFLIIATFALPKMIRHFIHGGFLISFGIIPLLHNFQIIGFNVVEWPILKYALTGSVILSGKTLIIDGFKEDTPVLQYVSIIVGGLIILMISIPTLSRVGAITFELTYSPFINYTMYLVSGILLIIGTFILKE